MPKNVNKKLGDIGFRFLSIVCKNLSTRCFDKTFFVVFLNSHCRETPEKAKKIKIKAEEKLTVKLLSIVWESFRHGLYLCEYIFVVFLNSPYLETSQNVPEKRQGKKKSAGGWEGLELSKCTGGPSEKLLPALTSKGRCERKKKVTQVSECFFWWLRKNFHDVF
jgi:hypothetical protein